jgi:RNA-directed DNA polymerase
MDAPCPGTGRSRHRPEVSRTAGRAGKAVWPKPAMNGHEKSDPAIIAMKPTNEPGRPGKERVERRAGAEGSAVDPHGVRAQDRAAPSSGIDRVRKTAQERKAERFTTLLHHIDASLLQQAYHWLKRDAAPGVDGVTWDAYGEGLEVRLRDLEARIHRGSYRAQPSLRAYIPKPDGRQRPLGIAALEDKIVQRAVVEVLNAIYETDFLGFSYGFRPGQAFRSALADANETPGTGTARRVGRARGWDRESGGELDTGR